MYELEFPLGYFFFIIYLNGVRNVDSGVVISDNRTLIYRFVQIQQFLCLAFFGSEL